MIAHYFNTPTTDDAHSMPARERLRAPFEPRREALYDYLFELQQWKERTGRCPVPRSEVPPSALKRLRDWLTRAAAVAGKAWEVGLVDTVRSGMPNSSRR